LISLGVKDIRTVKRVAVRFGVVYKVVVAAASRRGDGPWAALRQGLRLQERDSMSI
jgi:hypothetical protein